MHRLAVSLVVGVAVAAVPSFAYACSFTCGLAIERPSDGESHPANAALVISACPDFVETMLSITVDGMPATLGRAVPVPESSYGRVAILPPPTPGQLVVIEQCGEDAPNTGCPDPAEPIEILRYVAGPMDVEGPPAAGSVTLTHTFGPSEVACMETGDLEFHVELTGLDQGAEADVLYLVVLDNGAPEGNSDPERAVWVGPDPVTSLSFDIGEQLTRITMPPEEACVSVTAMDAAGHVTAIAETCGSQATNDPGGETSGGETSGGETSGGETSGGSGSMTTGELDSTSTGGEPPAGTSTASPTGDESGDADMNDDTSDRGCSCTTDGTAPAFPLALFALVVFGLRRRK